jgi:mRNA-degrading endonuclease RelE of RelBE toxin-antitoxin system
VILVERKITLSSTFYKQVKRLDHKLKVLLKKQILKIIENPQVGKPLKYLRGERVLYLKPFRIVYSYVGNKNEIILLKFDHRKRVYK